MTAPTLALGLLLAVLSAVAWSAFDAFRKILVAHVAPVPLTAVLAGAPLPLWLAWALIDGSVPTAAYIGPGIVVLLLNLGACLLFFEALRRADLIATIPLLALTPVFAAVLGVIFLDQLLAAPVWAGIMLVCAGAVGLNAGGAGVLVALRSGSGPALMVATAALWAGTAVFDRLCLEHASIAAHCSIQSVALTVALGIWLATRGEVGAMWNVRKAPWAFVGGVLVSFVALALQLWAILGVEVGVVEAVKRATGTVLALGVGRVVFGEQVDARRIVAVLAMAAGVWLMGAV